MENFHCAMYILWIGFSLVTYYIRIYCHHSDIFFNSISFVLEAIQEIVTTLSTWTYLLKPHILLLCNYTKPLHTSIWWIFTILIRNWPVPVLVLVSASVNNTLERVSNIAIPSEKWACKVIPDITLIDKVNKLLHHEVCEMGAKCLLELCLPQLGIA